MQKEGDARKIYQEKLFALRNVNYKIKLAYADGRKTELTTLDLIDEANRLKEEASNAFKKCSDIL